MTAGPLIIIGGHEDKEKDRKILKAIARRLNGGKLVVATLASHEPEGYFESYQKGFDGLGVGELAELYIDDRAEAHDRRKIAVLDNAAGVFFSGGDQLRISSQIGDTPLEARIREIWQAGGVLAGTSAGASVMSDTMMVRGASDESHRLGDLRMAPGLGLVRDVIIDQHFAERGRIGRLLGAVAQSPRVLGVGIDEDTAIVLEGADFEVLGSGAVYVVDAEGVSASNVAEGRANCALSMFDVRVHVLADGDRLNLETRRPHGQPAPVDKA
ncbi:MAG: cyanophycinase [Caulobacter sp.]|nr:cyanophycinase [Caulobacter sp.]